MLELKLSLLKATRIGLCSDPHYMACHQKLYHRAHAAFSQERTPSAKSELTGCRA